MSRKKSFADLKALGRDPNLAEAAEARLAAAARLELARAIHHLRATRKRSGAHMTAKKGTKIGGSSAADAWRQQTLGLITGARDQRGFGNLLSAAVGRLMVLEQRGIVSAAEAESALEAVTRHLQTKATKVGHMTPMIGSFGIPAEMSAFADGVSDDGSFDSEIVGCNCDPVAGLGGLAVAGLPSYLLTKKGLADPVLRRRAARAIKAMSPKLRRRVMARLAVLAKLRLRKTRVSGAIRSATPNVGWSGVGANVRVTPARCPYANVAGALTP